MTTSALRRDPRPHLLQRLLSAAAVLSLVTLLSGALPAQPQVQGTQVSSRPAWPGPVTMVPPAPQLDPYPTSTQALSVTFTGLAPKADRVRVSGPFGTTSAFPTGGGAFAIVIPLAQDKVNLISFMSVAKGGTKSAPTTATVTNDTVAPTVFIDYPADGATISAGSTAVAGRVGDQLSGFTGLQVSVNGIAATVDIGIGTNGTFFLPSLSLAGAPAGQPFTIQAQASDSLGNTSTAQIDVVPTSPPTGLPQMSIVSGDAQTGTVGSTLPQGLRVLVTTDGITPLANKWVRFEVEKSDGLLSATPTGTGSRTLQVVTDGAGEAVAYLTLGSDAGTGNNRVVVRSTSIAGDPVFIASALAQSPSRIHIGTGDAQSGEQGSQAFHPLVAWVSDGINAIGGVPVTFTVTGGDGLVDGQSQVSVTTDPTGHAAVAYQHGSQAGLESVEADFAGNGGLPARFQLSALARDQLQPTRLRGVALDNSSQPLGGADVVLTVGTTTLTTVTDVTGQFEFADVGDSGPGHLEVDALVATTLAGAPIAPGSYPKLGSEVNVVANADNVLPALRLPQLDPVNAVSFDNTQDVVLTVAGIEGLEMTVFAGSMTLPDGTQPGLNGAPPTTVSLNQVDFDEIPMPLPDGASSPLAWTLQPGGAHFDPPIEVRLPNLAGLAPGAVVYFLSFDHDAEAFVIVASGSVSEDGSLISTAAGEGISVAGWGGFCPPYPDQTEVGGAGGGGGPGWGASGGFFTSMIELLQLLDSPCRDLLDGTPAGYAAYKACVGNAANCAGNTAANAGGLPGTSTGGPITGLGGLVGAGLDELSSVLGSFAPQQTGPTASQVSSSPPLAANTVEILFEDVLEVTEQVPSTIVSWSARVSFTTPPAGIQVGDAVQLVDLSPYGYGAQSSMTQTVTVVEGPNQFIVDGQMIDVHEPPTRIAKANGRSSPIGKGGAFSVPNVPVNGGAPTRPLLEFRGQGIQWLAGPNFFLAPIGGGATGFGTFPLEPEVLALASLAVSGPTVPLTQVGETFQLAVTATYTDLSTADVTAFAAGTQYTSSNPAIASVSPDGLITAVGTGTVTIAVSNEGRAAAITFVVSLGDPLTTVEGLTLDALRSPIAGANVTVLPWNFTAQSGVDGRFSIPNVPSLLGDLHILANATVGSNQVAAVLSDVTPLPGEITDVGLLILTDAVFWAVDADGQWSGASNWSTSTVPSPADDVIVNRLADPTVTISSGATASSLQSDESLVVDGTGTLTVGGSASLTGSLQVSAGGSYGSGGPSTFLDLTLGGDLTGPGSQTGTSLVLSDGSVSTSLTADDAVSTGGTIDGSLAAQTLSHSTGVLGGTGSVDADAFTWNSGQLSVVDLTCDGGALTTFGSKSLDGSLTNEGLLIWNQGNLSTLDGGAFVNLNGATFDVQGDLLLLDGNGGAFAFTNAGTISKSAGTGSVSFHRSLDTSGTLAVQSGTLILVQGGTIGGVVDVSSGAGIHILGNSVLDGTSFPGSGGTLIADVAALTDVSFAGSLQLGDGGSTAVDVSGTLDAQVSLRFYIADVDSPAGVTGVLVNTPDLTWNGGSLELNGTVQAGGGTWTGGTVGEGCTVQNSGTTVWPWGDIYTLDDGAIVNLAGATLDIQGDQDLFDSNGGSFTVVNAGTFVKSGGTGTTGIHRPIDNTGTVSVQSGTLTIAAGGNLQGSFDVAAGSELHFTGNTTLDSVPITGAGGVLFSAPICDLTNLSFPGYVQLGGASNHTITVQQTLNAPFGMRIYLAEVDSPASHVLAGITTPDLSWDGAKLKLNGTIQTGGGTWTGGTVGEGCTLENSGTTVWPWGDIYTLDDGAIVNLTGATLDIQGDQDLIDSNGGSFTITNAGTLVKSAGTGTTAIQRPIDNTGTVSVQSGVLAVQSSFTQTAGTLDLAGGSVQVNSLNLMSGGTTRFEISGTSAGTGHGTITPNSGTLGGTLKVELAGGFTPSAGDTFSIIGGSGIGGTFDTLDFPTLPGGLEFSIVYPLGPAYLQVN